MTEQVEVLATPVVQPFDLAAAVEHGKKQVIQSEYKGVPYFVIPQDMKIANLEDLVNKQLQRPYSLEQAVTLTSEDSFVEYFNRFATETSTIFVNDAESHFVAILDYHDAPDLPKFKRHIAHYKCPKAKEFTSWIASNNKKMEQEEFALFIEENSNEILNPNPSEMLEIASTLKAKKDVEFSSGIRLDNGQVQFAYIETIQAQAGIKGQFSIPEKITLAIAPFHKGHPYEIEARFRHRINSKGMFMWYTLIRPHIFVDHAFTEIVNRVKEKMEKGKLVHGTISI